MRNFIYAIIGVVSSLVASPAMTANVTNNPGDLAGRIQVIPFQTLTLSDQHFLTGDEHGTPVSIAGTLVVPSGSGRRPLVVLIHGSGGISSNVEMWERHFLRMGVAVFYFDSFA